MSEIPKTHNGDKESFADLAKTTNHYWMKVIASEADRQGLTKEGFARRAGITDGRTLSRSFNDDVLPQERTLEKILRGLGIKPESILVRALRDELNAEDEIYAIEDVGKLIVRRAYDEERGVPEYTEILYFFARVDPEKRREILTRFIVRKRIIGAMRIDDIKEQLPLHALLSDLTLAGFHPSGSEKISPSTRRSRQRKGYLAYRQLTDSLSLTPEDILTIKAILSRHLGDYPLWDTQVISGLDARKEYEREWYEAYGSWLFGDKPVYQDIESPLSPEMMVQPVDTDGGGMDVLALVDDSLLHLNIFRDLKKLDHGFIKQNDTHDSPQLHPVICVDPSRQNETHDPIFLMGEIGLPVDDNLIDRVRDTQKTKKRTARRTSVIRTQNHKK
jgi:transcriptional regulator with XRE-family HTH domain